MQLTIFPSLNLREDFNDFAIRHGLYDKNENAKTVFVVPVFEKKKGSTCPDNKRELAESCGKNEVRSFHEEVNISVAPRFQNSDLQMVPRAGTAEEVASDSGPIEARNKLQFLLDQVLGAFLHCFSASSIL